MLDNKQDNFQLHRFTTSENIAKSFRGGTTFYTHYWCSLLVTSQQVFERCVLWRPRRTSIT